MPVWKPGNQIQCDGCGRVLVDAQGYVQHAYYPVHSRIRHEGRYYDEDGRKYELYDVPNSCLGSSECVEAIEKSDKWRKRQLGASNTVGWPESTPEGQA